MVLDKINSLEKNYKEIKMVDQLYDKPMDKIPGEKSMFRIPTEGLDLDFECDNELFNIWKDINNLKMAGAL